MEEGDRHGREGHVPSGVHEDQEEPRRLVVPLLHPIAITKDQWHKEPAQKVYIGRTKRRDFPFLDVTKPPPGGCLYPSLEDLGKFAFKAYGKALSIDLETCADHIICAGLRALDLETWKVGAGLTLRFRKKGGGLYWKWPEHVKVVEWFYRILAGNSTKVFWNGVTFDVPLLLKLGFEVNGRLVDGMVMQRLAYLEMPSSLQWVATVRLGMPVWKTLIDEEDEDK